MRSQVPMFGPITIQHWRWGEPLFLIVVGDLTVVFRHCSFWSDSGDTRFEMFDIELWTRFPLLFVSFVFFIHPMIYVVPSSNVWPHRHLTLEMGGAFISYHDLRLDCCCFSLCAIGHYYHLYDPVREPKTGFISLIFDPKEAFVSNFRSGVIAELFNLR